MGVGREQWLGSDRLQRLLSFPDPVNEVSARLVAGGVVLLTLAAVVLDQPWLVAVIAYGFVARVLAGPKLSPLGLLVTKGVTPRLGLAPRPVPGPPKRFAQGMGAAITVTAAVLALTSGIGLVVSLLLVALIVAATLESVFGLCVGCTIFALLMRAGLIPTEVCERCADVRIGRTSPPESDAARPALRRGPLVGLALVGVGLVTLPFAFRLFDRAPKGASMIAAFAPYMTAQRLDGYQHELRVIDAGVRESDTKAAALLTGASGGTAHARFDRRFPDFAAFRAQWPGIDSDMSGMLGTIQANRGNYDAVAALPSFRLFPWFFVIPGLVVLLALAALALRARWWGTARWLLAAVGIGLVAAPVAFRMFDRAPKGARMVSAFATIETAERVQTIQGYFGDMASGQGAVRLELIPALERTGLTRAEIAERLPAVDALDRTWVHILNDMTPMIGAMSDNVSSYRAVAALPSFALFPWFFVLPGVLVVGLAAAAGSRRRGLVDPSSESSRRAESPLAEGAS